MRRQVFNFTHAGCPPVHVKTDIKTGKRHAVPA